MEKISIGFVTRGQQRVPAMKIPCSNGSLLLRPVQSNECEAANELRSREFDRSISLFQSGMIAPDVAPRSVPKPAKALLVVPPQVQVGQNRKAIPSHSSCHKGAMRKVARMNNSIMRRDTSFLNGCESWKRSRNTQYK